MINRNFTSFPVLTTERLTLRQLSIDDQQNIFALRSNKEINQYLNREPGKTMEDAIHFINTVNDNSKKGNSLYWAISLTNTKTFVGTICLFNFFHETNTCEIGYELMPPFQGKGIMKEAAAKVMDYAFNTLQCKKIEAFLHRDNQRSIQLLEKLLFRHSDNIDKTMPELIYYHFTND
jgi:ribosomal-protein-alanine N-acetyltransferase